MKTLRIIAHIFLSACGVAGLGLFLYAQYVGLYDSPPERMMGDVARILYVHVPAAWICMVAYTLAFPAAVVSLIFTFFRKYQADWLTIAAVEVGVMLNVLLLILGSIFAKPTWNTWWTWDPRLTSALIMMLSFAAIPLVRLLVDQERTRAIITAVGTILAYINIPIVYFAVRWWRTIHQMQSSPDTMSAEMVTVLRMNAIAFLLLTVWWISKRWKVERARHHLSQPPLLPSPAGDPK